MKRSLKSKNTNLIFTSIGTIIIISMSILLFTFNDKKQTQILKSYCLFQEGNFFTSNITLFINGDAYISWGGCVERGNMKGYWNQEENILYLTSKTKDSLIFNAEYLIYKDLLYRVQDTTNIAYKLCNNSL